MTLATAFTLALTGGAVWGGVIGLVRTSRSGAGPVGSMTAWAWLGALAAAAVFGTLLALEGVLFFLSGPPSPSRLLGLTVLTVGLLGFVALLP
jgi:hypothetical protein